GIPLFGSANPSWGLVAATSAVETGYVVVNESSGPGTSPANATLQSNIAAARAAGRRVLGYVPLGYTPTGVSARGDGAILADVAAWRDLYGVDGLFLDEVQPECSVPSYGDVGAKYASLAASMRAVLPGAFLALNPGRNLGECFASSFDAVVAYEG